MIGDAAAGGLYVAVTLMAALWATWCSRRLDRHAFIAVVVGGYSVVFGLVPWLRSLLGIDEELSLVGAGAALLGLLGLFAGWTFVGRSRFRSRAAVTVLALADRYRRPRFLLLCAGAVLIGFLVAAIASAGSVTAFVSQGRFEFRGQGGFLGTIVGPLMMRLGTVPVFVLACSTDRRHRVMAWWAAVAGAVSVYVTSGGARSLAMGLLGAALIGSALRRQANPARARHPSMSGLKGLRRALMAVLAITLAGVLLSGLYEARRTLRTEGLSAITSSLASAVDIQTVVESEPFTYGQVLDDAVRLYPEDHDFLWVYPLRRLVFFPPGLGGLKPPDTNLVFAESLGVSGGTTIPPSLPGEGYVVAGGLFGVFPWLALYGVLIGWASTTLRGRGVVALVLAATSVDQGLLVLRGQLYEVVVTMVTLCVLVSALSWVSRWRLRGRRPSSALTYEWAARSPST